MITTMMQNVEPDLRPALLGHVVLTGAGSMMQGVSDRIHNELQQLFPAVRTSDRAMTAVPDPYISVSSKK